MISPFYRVAGFLYETVSSGKGKEKWKKLFRVEKVGLCLGKLNSGKRQDKEIRKYYTGKIALFLTVVFTGLLLSLIVTVTEEKILQNGRILVRGPCGAGEKETILRYTGTGKENRGKIKISVPAREYTEGELENLYREMIPVLDKKITGDSRNPDRVRENLDLVHEMKGFPFEIEWRTSDPSVMNEKGEIRTDEIPDCGEELELTADISYGTFRKIYRRPVRIFPPVLSKEEYFLKDLEEVLEISGEENRYEGEWVLPEDIKGEEIRWSEAGNGKAIRIAGFSVLIGILLFFWKDRSLKERIKKREQELLQDYPAIVSRITLFLNAGMTVKGAWKKIAGAGTGDTGKKEGYAQKEMKLACHEMDSGVSEVQAYERFGKRCGVQAYIKFAMLLSQNIQKGNRILLSRLKEESQLALLEKQQKVKMSAEEISTKLLFPMMLMLVMVMVLIMVPAFSSF